MLRDVLVASLNKGQFVIAVAALIIVVMLVRMPPEDVTKLAFEIIHKLSSGNLVGYALAVVLALCWYIHAKKQRRNCEEELKRLTGERTKLQKQTLGKKVVSSQAPNKEKTKEKK